jgi:hypothetical protein
MSVTVDIDLRDKLCDARDQRQRPTCLVFAVSGAHEASRASNEYLSPEFLFYSGVHRSHKDPNKGLTRTAVLEALQHDGQPLESTWPYLEVTPAIAKWQPPKLEDPTHKAVLQFAPRTLSEMRQVLRAGKPVLLILALTVAMYSPDADAIVRASAGDRVTTRRHALLAVGSGHASDGEYILVRNSWGQRWGHAGHGWLHDSYLTPQLETTGVIV